MSAIEDQYIAEGAQIVWVLQEGTNFQPATSQQTHDFYEDTIDSDVGIRVGDAETEPVAGTFENSPFITTQRGFAMIVRKSDMRVMFADTHGNERNLNGESLLDEVRAVPLE